MLYIYRYRLIIDGTKMDNMDEKIYDYHRNIVNNHYLVQSSTVSNIFIWSILLLLLLSSTSSMPISSDENVMNSTIITNANRSESILTKQCANGGVFVDGGCKCTGNFQGPACVDYPCVHGLSVGARYDPLSLFFNRKCICEENWDGEYCEIPIADQCNERGQYKFGRCICTGFYFGSECQYVNRCEQGRLKNGRCLCDHGWDGDYCDQIVCAYGYPDIENGSVSCVCPKRFAGQFCDRCASTALSSTSSGRLVRKLRPYPDCTPIISTSRIITTRQRTDGQIYARIVILFVAIFSLLIMFAVMYILHNRRKRAQQNFDQPSTINGNTHMLPIDNRRSEPIGSNTNGDIEAVRLKLMSISENLE